MRYGYTTAGYGKIRHWDGPDDQIWNDHYSGDWYGYQGKEWGFMKSAVMPDKVKPEEEFPDHIFATKTIEQIKKLHNGPNYFMVAVGFKMPHTALHIPYKYFDMYRSRSKYAWQLGDEYRKYPPSSAIQGHRCCADMNFRFMNNEGADRANHTEFLGNINKGMSQEAYTEMMWGYSAAITFLDKQLGRILDTLDELDLWKNLTIILTADHGMHNGEKGLW
jgi:arylsulfatase A-like enzyme